MAETPAYDPPPRLSCSVTVAPVRQLPFFLGGGGIFAADFLSGALFLSRFSSFTDTVTCKSIGVVCVCARARVRGKKRGSCLRDCVLCECGGGFFFLKKEGAKPGVSITRADRRGSDADSPVCDCEGGHVARRSPAGCVQLLATASDFSRRSARDQKITFCPKSGP